MSICTSDDYISNRAWLRDLCGRENVILCGVSALEYLQLFPGYVGESEVEVYATSKGKHSDISYRIVDSFSGIEHIRIGTVLCCSANQTFNDMLLDGDLMDEQAFVEALSKYYHQHNQSFSELNIYAHTERFDVLKQWAMAL